MSCSIDFREDGSSHHPSASHSSALGALECFGRVDNLVGALSGLRDRLDGVRSIPPFANCAPFAAQGKKDGPRCAEIPGADSQIGGAGT